MCPTTGFTNVSSLLGYVTCLLIKSVVPLLFALAFVAFIWGIIQMFLNPDNEEAKKKGKSFMIWGLIALTVMFSVWGLVEVITSTFGINVVIPKLSQ